MNVPTESEKKNESNGENTELADITCEVCGYKGKPEDDGRCPTCGAIGGVKPGDPALKGRGSDSDGYIDSANLRDQIEMDLAAQGEGTLDYI